jgi:hypothetical protein
MVATKGRRPYEVGTPTVSVLLDDASNVDVVVVAVALATPAAQPPPAQASRGPLSIAAPLWPPIAIFATEALPVPLQASAAPLAEGMSPGILRHQDRGLVATTAGRARIGRG